jgi:hypothetical protein
MAGAGTGGWVASAASTTGAMNPTEVKAAAAAGAAHYIDMIVFTNEGTANSFILKDGDGTAVYPPTGAIYLGANQTFNTGLLPYRIKVVTAKSITCTTTAADHAACVVHGYTQTV